MLKYIGIPYKLGGRDFLGCDCYGLVYLYLNEQGYTLPKYDIQYSMDDRKELIDVNRELLLGEQLTSSEENAIALIYRGKYPVHMGVVVNQGLLHTTTELDSVWEPLIATSLRRFRLIEYYQISDEYRVGQ